MTPDQFWDSRPILGHVRSFARSRRVGPWSTLGAVLVRAVCSIPPHVALPPTVGGRVAPNLFVGLVGPSGMGKGGSEAAARDAVSFQYGSGTEVEMPEFPLGSGEGVARTLHPNDDETIHTALFTASEIDTLAALFSRQGATLEATLRQLYTSEEIGFANAQKHTRTHVPRLSYRAGLLVGIQPGRSGVLLNGADGGTPQRLLWMPVRDIDIPDDAPLTPERVVVAVPGWSSFHTNISIPLVATNAIVTHQIAMHRGEVDPLDGHALLTHLKAAAALMALDGRQSVTDEDWELASVLMTMSTITRNFCQNTLAEQSRKTSTARAQAVADREEILSDNKTRRAREGILRWLADGNQLTRSELRRRLKADIRDYFDGALAELLDSRQLTETPGSSGATRYTCTPGTPRKNSHLAADVPGVPKVHGVPARVTTLA